MDFNTTIDLIIKDLNEAREIIDDLKKYQGVPVLQVELAKSKCKSAAEIISLLKSIKETPLEPVKEPVKEPKPILEPEVIREQKVIKKPEVIQEQEVIQKPEMNKEQEPESELIKETETSFVIEQELAPKIKHKTGESAIIADKFSHMSNRFNEQMGNHKADDDRLIKKRHISNLSEAIGINDKFLFIREIFNNNKETYTQAITRLDKSESIEDARAIIMTYIGEDNENEAAKQLLDLVKRKLPSDE